MVTYIRLGRIYKREFIREFSLRRYPCVEVGSNTSTVTLRVVVGDKKGSLESETVKCGRESHGTRIRE
jgi:hypothetical protein